MKKILFLVLGLLFGFLFAEIVRHKQTERLKELEAKEGHRKANNAQYEREWQRELANMPFDERMDWELFEAGLKLDGWIGDDDDEKP